MECPHASVGCTFTCQRQHLPVHLSSNCDYVQVQCSQEGCTHTVLRKDLGKHAADCTHRLVECEACGRDVRLSEIEVRRSVCPSSSFFFPWDGPSACNIRGALIHILHLLIESPGRMSCNGNHLPSLCRDSTTGVPFYSSRILRPYPDTLRSLS